MLKKILTLIRCSSHTSYLLVCCHFKKKCEEYKFCHEKSVLIQTVAANVNMCSSADAAQDSVLH
jgi:hypothetical protein